MLQHIKAREDWDDKSVAEKGFTLIELLVVIVILGILAAVVVFAVGGITDKGQKASCLAEANTVRTAAESYAAQNNNAYAADGAALKAAKFLSNTPTLVTYTGTGTGFTLAWAGACTTTAGLPATP